MRVSVLTVLAAVLISSSPVGAADRVESEADQALAASAAAPEAPAPLATIAVAPESAATTAPEPAPRSASRLIDEVIVTAQKREESIKDVPISITAFSAGQLDAKQVLDVSDLPKLTPGLNITSVVGLTSVYLRGVGSDASVLGDPLVVTYIDNVYFPSGFGQLQDFGSIEDVEILKGPQGTLFGRNALGGAIKVKTRDPSLEHFESSVTLGYGSYDTFKSRAYVSTPLTEGLAVSLSGLYNRGDNPIDGRDTPDRTPLRREKQDSYRIKLYWKPADWTDLRLNVYDLSSSGTVYGVNTKPTLVGAAAGIQPGDPRRGANDATNIKTTEVTTYFGQLSFYLPWADIKLLGSDQEVEDVQNLDFDGSPLPLANFNSDPGFSDAQTAELQILSNDGSAGADWLQWIAGVYYFDALAGFDPAFLAAGATDLTEGIIAGIQVPDGILDLIDTALGNAPVPAGAKFSFVGNLRTESIAYYTQATITFTDALSMTLGARYQDEQRTLTESSAGLALLNGSRIVYQSFSGNDDPRFRGTTKSFDPKVSLSFRPGWAWLGSEPLLYTSYQTATTSLTFNAINILDAPEEVKSTEITAYETGFKTRLFDGLMDLNMAAFHYKIEDPQIQTISLLAGGAVRFENAGGQRIRGAEFDALVQVLPQLTGGGLVMTASGTYLDAVYTSFTNGSGFNETTGVYEGGQDYSGKRIQRAPRFTGTLGLLQTIELGSGTLEVGVDYYYNSGFSYLAQGTPNNPAFDTLGANLSYLYQPRNVRISVYGRNVLDEDYNASRFMSDFGVNDTRAPLANYGVRLNWDF